MKFCMNQDIISKCPININSYSLIYFGGLQHLAATICIYCTLFRSEMHIML